MSRGNGHADPRAVATADQSMLLSAQTTSNAHRLPPEKINQLIAEMEVPFDVTDIEWRVTTTAQEGKRGQIVPYANARVYADRLNALVTPAGWTRKYSVHTSPNFERAKDNKMVGKILVTCELTIFGVGSHSATGEEWSDDPNGLTAAEAQSFKRSCACFGLGRYLYHFTGVWVDLDERKRPKTTPRLFDWATPEGWRAGQRPRKVNSPGSKPISDDANAEEMSVLVRQIEEMAEVIGRRLYRGVLKSVARVWNASEIHDLVILRTVLKEMRATENELCRLDAVLNQVEQGALTPILRSLRIQSVGQIDSTETLKRVIAALTRESQVDNSN